MSQSFNYQEELSTRLKTLWQSHGSSGKHLQTLLSVTVFQAHTGRHHANPNALNLQADTQDCAEPGNIGDHHFTLPRFDVSAFHFPTTPNKTFRDMGDAE
jgi:hypothetical protein